MYRPPREGRDDQSRQRPAGDRARPEGGRGERPARRFSQGEGGQDRGERRGNPRGDNRNEAQPRFRRPDGDRPRTERPGPGRSEKRDDLRPRGVREALPARRFDRQDAQTDRDAPPRRQTPSRRQENPGHDEPREFREFIDPARPRSGSSGTEGLERIAKVMARAGLCSRRDAETWIEAGRVSVNGAVIASPALDVGPNDRIMVDNVPLPARERTRLWLYHKPRGLMTTADDPEGRATVFDNLPEDLPRVVSVGRLDYNTEGLLLLTNDGGLARVLGHPSTGWLRRYKVRAHGVVDLPALDRLKEGITIDGVDYEPINATLNRVIGANSWLTLDLTEGKNREVRRVLEHMGLQVNRLIRISFGPFQLGDMPEGAVEEIRTRHLKDQLGPRLMEESGADFDAPVFDGRTVGESAEETTEAPKKKRYTSKEDFQEKRRKAQTGADDSVSVETGTVADRKGRVVTVQRLRVKPEPEPEFKPGRTWDERSSDNRSTARDGERRGYAPKLDRIRPEDMEPRRARPAYGERPQRSSRDEGGAGTRETGGRAPRTDAARTYAPRGDERGRDGAKRSFAPRSGAGFGGSGGRGERSNSGPGKEGRPAGERSGPRSGPARSGPPRSGAPKSGPARSGPPRSGPPRSGPPRSGPPRSGGGRPPRSGPRREG
jgi:23S rRNA pseudouridine2605 synthase